MKEILLKGINYFIKDELKGDESLYEKAKITVIIFVLVFLITLLYSSFYLKEGYLFDVKSIHNYIGISISLIGLQILKKTGKINLALGMMAIISVYLVSASIFLSGGIRSNDIMWYMVVATSAFMFINIITGFIVSSLSLIGLTIFFILEYFKLKDFDLNIVSASVEYRYFNFVLILILLVTMIYILVRGNQSLLNVIKKSKQQKLREEIAQDFHDQIGNKLASLRHLAELVKLSKTEDKKESLLNKIDVTAKDVYDNFRDFIWTIDSNSNYVHEQYMYLRDFADDYFKFSSINLFINSSPEKLPFIELTPQQSKELIPLCKELVTNAYKHSNASNIWFEFKINDNLLMITIKDDGIGMDITTLKKGNGLRNIETRVKRSGGQIDFNSQPNIGTEVIYRLKLPN